MSLRSTTDETRALENIIASLVRRVEALERGANLQGQVGVGSLRVGQSASRALLPPGPGWALEVIDAAATLNPGGASSSRLIARRVDTGKTVLLAS